MTTHSQAARRKHPFQATKAKAERGDAEAQYYLGARYHNGEGVETDYAEAVKWYRKGAEQGYPDAQRGLGDCYNEGKGVEKNGTEAMKWYRKAAEQDTANNQKTLSKLQNNAPTGTMPVPSQSAITSTGIDMVKDESGVLKVPVQINGAITLKFVIDSGASEVQIPKDVVLALIRAETIKESDFRPGKTFVLADGSKVKSDRFILRSIKVGESTFAEIEASVGGLDAQLLLGQSFLSRFKEWKIDNKNGKLIFTK